MLTIVLAQVVLTFSNAILATCLAVNERFPNKRIEEESLAMNMGLMNTLLPFIGGVPMCHGACGFASQYFFGARTGGAMVMEGVSEILLALLLAEPVTEIFKAFPLAIIGVILFFASLELGKYVTKVRKRSELLLITLIGLTSFLINIAVGFFTGLLVYYLLMRRFNLN